MTSGTRAAAAGYWRPGPAATAATARGGVYDIRKSVVIVAGDGIDAVTGGDFTADRDDDACCEVVGLLPATPPELLGHSSFRAAHGVELAYVAGEMANGIATTAMVAAMARAGMLGFFGAAGLEPAAVRRAVRELTAALGEDRSWGASLIHSPNHPRLERDITGLYLREQVRRVCASAFMDLTSNVVRYAASGLHVDRAGRIVRPNHLFAKVSRPEVARHFMAPAPDGVLSGLVAENLLTAREAELARRVPIAADITVEADSGGHTDNGSLMVLIPAMTAQRDDAVVEHGYPDRIRIGAAGGLGTPESIAAAFALGADYVLTGSVNQSAVESGLSDEAKTMLATADLADVAMAPAGDMLELGAQVQVLRRGTMFAVRATRLAELYRTHAALEELPKPVVAKLERDVFRAPLHEIWHTVQQYWTVRDPSQLVRAEQDPRHRMALMFRWYLGNATRWAITGDPDRRTDYQVWCGPAMGAFNRWAAGTFLAALPNRHVAQIALNLMEGAAVATRRSQLRTHGVDVSGRAARFVPHPFAVR